MQEDEHTLYQYREARNLIFVSLDKRFALSKNAFAQSGFFIGAQGKFYFGGYKGASKNFAELIPVPQIGFYRQTSGARLKLSYEYITFAPQNLSPHVLNFSTSFILRSSLNVYTHYPTF